MALPFPLRRDDARLSRTEGRRPVLQDSRKEGQIPFFLGWRDSERLSRTEGWRTPL